MIPVVQHKHPQLAALCRKYGVRRLELFGSAATAGEFVIARRIGSTARLTFWFSDGALDREPPRHLASSRSEEREMRRGSKRRKIRSSWLRGLLFAIVIASFAGQVGIAAERAATIDDVRKAWSKRQKNLQSLTIRWQRKYSAVWRDPGRGGPRPEGAPKAGETYSYVQKAVARFDGEMFDLRIHVANARRFAAADLDRSAFDGKHSRELTVLSFPKPHTQGFVSSRKHEFGPNKALFIPLAINFRPLVATISQFEFKSLRLEPRESSETKVDGHLCRMVIRKTNDVIEFVYYVDPKADWLIRRIESRVKGRRSLQWDISYSHDKRHG